MSSPSNQYRCWLQGPAGQQYQADRSLLDQWQPDGDEFLWLDCNLQDEAEFTRLLQRFAVHELAVSALLRERHPPKYEHFGQQLLIIYRGLQQLPQDFPFCIRKLVFWLVKISSSAAIVIPLTVLIIIWRICRRSGKRH